jgi:mono/diheme cytochrome c family protein
MNLMKMFLAFLLVLVILMVTIPGCKRQTGDQAELVARGEYLVNLGDCNFCHTPKIWTSSGMELDQSKLLSGHPEGTFDSVYTSAAMGEGGVVCDANSNITQWSGPWGISFAANLTPDETTGLGAWSESDFIKTIRTGKHLGSGHKILLPMPWYNLAKLTDDDLRAIFAYLKSIKPVKNSVPVDIPREEAEVDSSR